MRLSRKKGFTLIELMAVSAMVSAVSTTAYQAIKKAKETQCVNNLKQIYLAVNMFVADHGGAPTARFFPESASDSRALPNLLRSYGVSKEIFFCPGLPSELNARGINYLWNDVINGRDLAALGKDTWLMTEMTAVNKQVPPPHLAGFVILYGDGHTGVGRRIKLPGSD
ncbi:MAG: prepilin-type N-terminal cleavage/methylation domain-containing protein [Candidatus Omnitrophica bacterium]|nr:prepilin-type N-terminal cleavage/methylation domain-containing protein [Candidatus Omnitrophota bacterium]